MISWTQLCVFTAWFKPIDWTVWHQSRNPIPVGPEGLLYTPSLSQSFTVKWSLDTCIRPVSFPAHLPVYMCACVNQWVCLSPDLDSVLPEESVSLICQSSLLSSLFSLRAPPPSPPPHADTNTSHCTFLYVFGHLQTHHVMWGASWGPDDWNLSVGSCYTEHHRGSLSSHKSTKP